jgi:hypothetical protein
MLRKNRRSRKTPCRQNRENRARGSLAPSTKARWQAKLRMTDIFRKLIPIIDYVVEDIKAKTRGQKRWDQSFSPLEIGKKWFYSELGKVGKVHLKSGFDTYTMRNELGLKKTNDKMSEKFSAHNVDSWVLANCLVGGHLKPDNEGLVHLVPLRCHRRQLHVLQPSKNGIRKKYGGTSSLGFKRGSLVSHKKHGVVYVGGTRDGRITVHSMETGERLSRKIKVEDCKLLTYNSWRRQGNSRLKPSVS